MSATYLRFFVVAFLMLSMNCFAQPPATVSRLVIEDCLAPAEGEAQLLGSHLQPNGLRELGVVAGQGAFFPLEVVSWGASEIRFKLPAAWKGPMAGGFFLALRVDGQVLIGPPTVLLRVDICGPGAASASVPQLPATAAAPVEEPAPKPKIFVAPNAGSGALAPAPAGRAFGNAALGGAGKWAVFETEEVLTAQSSMEQAKAADLLVRRIGGFLIRRRQLKNLDLIISSYRIPVGESLPQQIEQLESLDSSLVTDLNHRYELQQASHNDPRTQSFFAHQLGWSTQASTCGRGQRIGIVDTPVNRNHPALRSRNITVFSALPAGVLEASADHGTAVAALLVGDPQAQRHQGLIPSASLFAAQVFRKSANGQDTTAEWLVIGLDWLVSQRVEVINLSLGGPANRILKKAIERIESLGITLVAAAGNGGEDAAPDYPGAWASVVAVTAVDADLQLYSDANRGEYIDYAAPGVDVWGATAEGDGRFYSGTSFAAPFVTAAIAVLGTNAQTKLAQRTRDLGAPGHDRDFGAGLIQMKGFSCQAVNP